MRLSRKTALILPLLFALYLLKDKNEFVAISKEVADNDADSTEEFLDLKNRKTLAVITALRRHPPALRVFRAVFEVSLVLLGTAVSLHIWIKAAGKHVVGQLMFQPPPNPSVSAASKSYSGNQLIHGKYQQIASNDIDEEEHFEDEDDVKAESKPVISEADAVDADYASDGEVVGAMDDITLDGTTSPEPPTPVSVASIAVDLILLVLVSLFLFTLSSAEGGRYIQGNENYLTVFQIMANVAAPIVPLMLFCGVLMLSIFPWKRRRSLWIILSYTMCAPFCDVTFRDGFVGDVLTSSVRPLQDISFTLFYILSGLSGWWTQAYDLDGAALPVEKSWLVHTVVLPACMLSPLWWRFNQNLRQVYDSKRRWPYLGNALKYLVAAQVAMMGVFDPTRKASSVWITCAVLATLYQVWWDVVMDWDLLRYNSSITTTNNNDFGKFTTTTTIRLRDERLYRSKSIYWTILIINLVLRFGWTITFMPRQFLDQTGALKSTFEGIFTYVDPLLASAEILRRTLWGFLRFELEAIKSHGDDPNVKAQLIKCQDTTTALSLPQEKGKDGNPTRGEVELQTISQCTSNLRDSNVGDHIGELKQQQTKLPDFLSMSHPRLPESAGLMNNDISGQSHLFILFELGLWTAAFTLGGILSAFNRGTL